MPRRLFVAWQDSQTRTWHTVARLEKVAGEYELVFTEGAREFKSILHSLFMMDPQYRYRFKDLIPAFKNKIPPKSRSDYDHLSRWFGVSGHEDDYELLAKFGTMQGNDPLIVYPEPLVTNGKYECSFFIHAVRYMHPDALNWLKAAEHGAIVLPMLDVMNEVDPQAVALRSSPGSILIGYVPAYLAKDIGTLLKDPLCAKNSHFTISTVNTEAPIQMIAMCRLVAQIPFDFKALDTQNHRVYGTIM